MGKEFGDGAGIVGVQNLVLEMVGVLMVRDSFLTQNILEYCGLSHSHGCMFYDHDATYRVYKHEFFPEHVPDDMCSFIVTQFLHIAEGVVPCQ